MLKHFAGLLVASGLFVGAMALGDVSSTAHAQFIPYSGPYRTPPPPPHLIPEEIPTRSATMKWVPGRWQWVGNGYRWSAGHRVQAGRSAVRPGGVLPDRSHLLRS
ncbi:YXWGXW repeat-containing protein [Gluconobacter wancherniae]|uniref:Uncharacterized protein n=1 Tax=Gluconobacter wancherniae NBRC 103581 TaxID=656744 RepID=A0A511AZ96_9PROT|nr:YXWGXW repeat-containing protein [Gluconobacter wancherniae]MBS1093377.1 hypothetical protein [Gluconobacter wancherniae]GBD56476.1 hypothetical protein NBRC103581_01053 [Gluconobacter wancherniae NBRC 103581]GBR63942.1 hypothetical protein AA103581_1062 [Gluconobacter wancherniae NBRC 103581]GEK92623.1 hypothetical protein GWA01_03930 [Gluconobacter wancherniae NBRC 103581]